MFFASNEFQAPAGSCCENVTPGTGVHTRCGAALNVEACAAHVMGCRVMCTAHLEQYFARHGSTLDRAIENAKKPRPAHRRNGFCPACGDDCML